MRQWTGPFWSTRVGSALIVGFALLVCFELSKSPNTHRISQIVALVGTAFVAWFIAEHPVGTVCVTLVFLPLQTVLLALAYHNGSGAPGVIVRPLGLFKEAMVVGLAFVVFRQRRRGRLHLSAPGAIALGFFLLAAFYFVVPSLGVGVKNLGRSAQISAFRLNVLFVVSFLFARQVVWPAGALRKILIAACIPGPILGAGAIWEVFSPAGFARFLNLTVRVGEYRYAILHLTGFVYFANTTSTTGGRVRASSWQLDPLALGFCLVLPTVLLLVFAFRTRNLGVWGAFGLTAAGLVLTQTRSSLLAGVVGMALVAVRTARLRVPGRAGLAVAGLLALVVLGPFAAGTSVAHRIEGAVNGTDSSTKDHEKSTPAALRDLAKHPLGLGLGVNPVTADADKTGVVVTAENGYIQVGNELGWAGALLFVALMISTLLALGGAGVGRDGERAPPSQELPLEVGVWAAGWGLALNAMFLHVWLCIPAALTFWTVAGVALATRSPARGADGPVPTDVDAERELAGLPGPLVPLAASPASS